MLEKDIVFESYISIFLWKFELSFWTGKKSSLDVGMITVGLINFTRGICLGYVLLLSNQHHF
jgi:hypothetical protein